MEPERDLELSWLLAQQSLKLRAIVPGNATFSVIQPTELKDPTPFLSPRAIVLSVGIAFESCPEELDDYVRRLHHFGAKGLGFGTGLVFDSVPEIVRDTARELGFPVFEVPHAVSFLSIQNAASQEQHRQEHHAQQALNQWQREATQAAISGGVDELLRVATTRLRAAVAIVDNDERLLASLPYQGFDATQGESRYHLRHRMLNFGERHHYFLTCCDRPLNSHERHYLKHCMGLADLLLQRPVKLRSARSTLNTLALSVLLGLDADTEHLSRAFRRITDSQGRVRPVVLHCDTTRAHQHVLDTIDAALLRRDRELCALELDSTTSLLFFRGSRSVSNIVSLLGSSRQLARIALGTTQPWQNVSRTLVESLAVSARSLNLGHYLGPEETPLEWMRTPEVQQVLAQRTQATLHKLAQDTSCQPGLLETLETYLYSSGNTNETATKLGVHRQTVRHRLNRIEQLCEVDLHNPVTRAELLIMLVGYRG